MNNFLFFLLLQATTPPAPLPNPSPLTQPPTSAAPSTPKPKVSIAPPDNVAAMSFLVPGGDAAVNEQMKKIVLETAMQDSLMSIFLELVKRNDKNIDAILTRYKVTVIAADGKVLFPRAGK